MPNTGISILIVDDEPPVRSLLIEILSPMFQCSSADSTAEAIRLMALKFFHLAIVDLGLQPGMSGLALCRLIVNRSPGTIVIMVSGHTDDGSIAEAIKAGAAAYITKPFALAHVVATVERLLESNRPGAVA